MHGIYLPPTNYGHCWNSLEISSVTCLVGYGFLMFEWRLRCIVIFSCLLFFCVPTIYLCLTCESAIWGIFRNLLAFSFYDSVRLS